MKNILRKLDDGWRACEIKDLEEGNEFMYIEEEPKIFVVIGAPFFDDKTNNWGVEVVK